MGEVHVIEKLVVRLSPEPICDECIIVTLRLSPSGAGEPNAGHIVRELAGSNGFERRKDTCSLCGETHLVTRQK
ncbi:hypothetical protein [Novosphingobium sp. TCA1]|uniref:hypothetical protein n=1 Tax=Novosphingobium sp. TCA1 TaxID=2682474 RepID=UPI00135823CA|nr:hypothetical protein [Novosphingobium sp. TCA1]